MARRAPWALGVERSRWRLADLGRAVPWLRGRPPGTVHRVLRRLTVRHKRGRTSLHSPDPADDAKLAAVTAAQLFARADPGRVALLYQDEFTDRRRPSLGPNRTRRIAACVDAVSGRVVARRRRRFARDGLARCFAAVAAASPAHEHVFVALDNWPVHFHPDLLAALPPHLTLLPLPTYAPWTNPVEDLWRALLADVLHHHPFADDWPGLQAATEGWLARWAEPCPALLHRLGLAPPPYPH